MKNQSNKDRLIEALRKESHTAIWKTGNRDKPSTQNVYALMTIYNKEADETAKDLALGMIDEEEASKRLFLYRNNRHIIDDTKSDEEVKADQKRQETAAIDLKKRQEEQQSILAEARALAPKNATGFIIACKDVDDSDVMTDYFAHITEEVVIIGFKTTKRESFAALRKAAAQFEPTKHLGPGKATARPYCYTGKDEGPNVYRDTHNPYEVFDTEAKAEEWVAEQIKEGTTFGLWARDNGYFVRTESIEHRENYSMGAGNYLKRGGRDRTGWSVKSVPLGSVYPHPTRIELPKPKPTTAKPATGEAEIREAENSKGDFFLVLLPSMDRTLFNQMRDRAKSLSGWYSRRWGVNPGGFGFNTRKDAENFLSLSAEKI